MQSSQRDQLDIDFTDPLLDTYHVNGCPEPQEIQTRRRVHSRRCSDLHRCYTFVLDNL